jgi:hypothetical protein
MTSDQLLAHLVKQALQGKLSLEQLLDVMPHGPREGLYGEIYSDIADSAFEEIDGSPNCSSQQLRRLAVDAAILHFRDTDHTRLYECRKSVLRHFRKHIPTIEEAIAEIEKCVSWNGAVSRPNDPDDHSERD